MKFPVVFTKDGDYIILLGPVDKGKVLRDRPTSPGIRIYQNSWGTEPEYAEFKDDFFADLDQFGWTRIYP